jgi:ElaB/YqjD/DUF883 family membrane-anchored ribosome-binding protein
MHRTFQAIRSGASEPGMTKRGSAGALRLPPHTAGVAGNPARVPAKERHMLLDAKQLKTAVATDFEELAAQFAALRDDMVALSKTVTATAERRGRRMAADVSDGMGEAVHYVERKSLSAEAELERSITTHPLLALGLAAGAGLLLGVLTRR